MRPGRVDLHPQRTRAVLLARKMTFTDSERRELGELIVDHAGSWSRLDEQDARRIADALTAFAAVQWILMQRNEKAAGRG